MAKRNDPLEHYNKKRDFRSTPEPKGKIAHSKTQGLSYVVQKHEARKLHYDLRLEVDGVLKSWAVPKGLSHDTNEKRLAVATEDHPLAYKDFEGHIPSGYGAGHMKIWDEGTWTPIGDPVEGLKKGKLKFELEGRRYSGFWNLVRTSRGESQWLVMKESKPTTEKQDKPRTGSAQGISPQLATLADRPPKGKNWVHEIKYDGYRLLAYCSKGDIRMITRNGHDWTEKFTTISLPLEKLGLNNTVLDGEVVALDKKGLPNFTLLQEALAGKAEPELVYYVFDLPIYEGKSLQRKTLEQRKAQLKSLLPEAEGPIVYSEHQQVSGEALLKEACTKGLEGIISKELKSKYHQGRSRNWIKSKCTNRQEFLVVGWTPPKGGRGHFGSLLIGYYEEKELLYAGRVGTGFSASSLSSISKELKPLKRAKTPLITTDKVPERDKVTWVEPEMIIEVNFAEWTPSGIARHPSYVGVRKDKKASEIGRERQLHEEDLKEQSSDKLVLAGVEISHPEKMYFPDAGLSKGDLAQYYEQVADRILPHIENRLISLQRCPEGWNKDCFFQRHYMNGFGEGVEPFSPDKKGKDYFYITSKTGLLSLVQFGGIEIHPWGSRVDKVESPDQLTMDIDPSEEVEWEQVISTALQLKEIFDELELCSFVKTTGGKGLHVVVPLDRRHDWDELKSFASSLAALMARGAPDLYTDKMSKAKRTDKIFIDWFRNARAHTSVAPYVVRAREGAPISIPISWKEAEQGINPSRFHLFDAEEILSRPDPWEDYFSVKQSLKKSVIKKLASFFGGK